MDNFYITISNVDYSTQGFIIWAFVVAGAIVAAIIAQLLILLHRKVTKRYVRSGYSLLGIPWLLAVFAMVFGGIGTYGSTSGNEYAESERLVTVELESRFDNVDYTGSSFTAETHDGDYISGEVIADEGNRYLVAIKP